MVAYSGGPDSTALLDLLLTVATRRDFVLVAAHFDHGVRPESRREADRAAERAREMGVSEVRVARGEPGEDPGHDDLRRMRYRFLRRVADETAAERIATGHQADDQAETVLFRILRGTGLRGLAGIPARRGRVVRPLLPYREDELLEHLERRGLAWTRDPANRDPGYARSRIRHELMPALERCWTEDPTRRLLQVGGAARRADELLDTLTDRALEACRREARGAFRVPELTADAREERRVRLRRPCLLAAGRELQARVLRRLARERGERLTRGGTAEAVAFINGGRSGGRVHLGGGLELWREFDSLWVGAPEPVPVDRPLAVDASAPGGGRTRTGGRSYEVRWGPDLHPARFVHSLAMPREIRQFSLTVRSWRPGDRIDLEEGRLKLKELFNRRRVPLSERRRLPLLVAGEEDVIWVPGIASLPDEARNDEWLIGVRG